jgi:hypothetical protein
MSTCFFAVAFLMGDKIVTRASLYVDSPMIVIAIANMIIAKSLVHVMYSPMSTIDKSF